MFAEAWRLERDYFYDRGMHGVDWPAMRAKYLPLVDRVTDRAELCDLLAPDGRRAVRAAHLRPRRRRCGRAGRDRAGLAGRRARRATRRRAVSASSTSTAPIPTCPTSSSPLARPGVDVRDGDVIVAINGVATP